MTQRRLQIEVDSIVIRVGKFATISFLAACSFDIKASFSFGALISL